LHCLKQNVPALLLPLLQVDVQDADDVAALMSKGASQRATSETKMNDRSSRSHQILTVIVDGVHKLTRARSHGCLHLIDLAGSERVSKSEASGEQEVRQVNAFSIALAGSELGSRA
jgi:kinesin family protein C2/C3